jgi:hypothetical protein
VGIILGAGFDLLSIRKNLLTGMHSSRGNLFYLSLLIFLNIIFYLVCIYKAPGFSSDDYYIFYLTGSNPAPVSLNVNEIFYLFLRPLSYFSFWLTYNLFGNDALLMKIFSLILHTGLITLIWMAGIEILKVKGRGGDVLVLFLCLLLFSVHPDTLMYILHINNRTELLMLLFYAGCILVTLRYLNGSMEKVKFLVMVTLFYTLSVLSKQNGLHFPMLLLFPLIYMELSPEKKKTLLQACCLLAVLLFFFSLINIRIGSSPSAGAGLLRKPFSAAGILLFTAFPFIAEEVYSWFLHNSQYAIAAVLLIPAISTLLAEPKRKAVWGVGIPFFTLCLFYPRIFALGGGRINTHLVLWMILFLHIFLLNKNAVFRYYIPAAMAVVFGVYSLGMADKIEENNLSRKKQSLQLQEIINIHGKPFVALSGMAASLNEYHYHTEGSFGKPDFEGSALVYKYLFPGREKKEKVISCHREGDILVFNSSDKDVFIGEHPINRATNKYEVRARGKLWREYHSYSIKIPPEVQKDNVLVFHNGLNWEIISL